MLYKVQAFNLYRAPEKSLEFPSEPTQAARKEEERIAAEKAAAEQAAAEEAARKEAEAEVPWLLALLKGRRSTI